MKRFLSLILSLTSLFIVVLSVYSCAKNDNSEVDGTSVLSTTTVDENCYNVTKAPRYDMYSPDSFVDYWKKQQKSDDPETVAWRALDGSAETSLLYPKVKRDEYEFTCAQLGNEDWYSIKPTSIAWINRENTFINYVYNYSWGGDDWTEATMTIMVFKGNPVNDIFLKDELTYDDLKYFVNTYDWNGYNKVHFEKIEYVNDMVLMRNEHRVEVYFIYAGQIVNVGTTDKYIVASPENLFDHIYFEEIPLE